MDFPEIPEAVIEDFYPKFLPSDELRKWVFATFIDQNASLRNPNHEHLQLASIGFLWTNKANARAQSSIIGMAQIGQPNGPPWSKGPKEQQLEEWFGGTPDFVITLSAPWCAEADMMSICALIEHELCHCSYKGYTRQGIPKWLMRAHDVEEFVTVVDRYGIGNKQHSALRAMIDAAKRKPSVGQAKVEGICGSCLRKVA